MTSCDRWAAGWSREPYSCGGNRPTKGATLARAKADIQRQCLVSSSPSSRPWGVGYSDYLKIMGMRMSLALHMLETTMRTVSKSSYTLDFPCRY